MLRLNEYEPALATITYSFTITLKPEAEQETARTFEFGEHPRLPGTGTPVFEGRTKCRTSLFINGMEDYRLIVKLTMAPLVKLVGEALIEVIKPI